MTGPAKRHALNLSRIVGGAFLMLAIAHTAEHITRARDFTTSDVKVYLVTLGVGLVLCFPGLSWKYAQIILPRVSFGKASKDEEPPTP